MNSNLPEILKQGEPARLFPLSAGTRGENRLTSVFLAILPQIPALAKDLMPTVGKSVGQRSKIECWTEVVLTHGDHLDKRPDGLIIVKTGKVTWRALIEAKIKNNPLDEDQVTNYVKVAKDSEIDAVITISNQFVVRADHSPVKVDKRFLRKTNLFHWSWTYIQTRCEILCRDITDNSEQAFMLAEFLRLLEHKDSGVQRFTQMNKGWRELVMTVSNQGALNSGDSKVVDCIGSWHQEERDLSLQLSRHVGAKVQTVIARKTASNLDTRLEEGISQLISEKVLQSTFRIPNCAADIEVFAHLMARTLTFGMRLKAPLNIKTTNGRVNWLLRMLHNDDHRLVIRAHWPGRTEPTDASIADLRINAGAIQASNSKITPHGFEVLMIDNLGSDFLSRKKFIERLEKNITLFYDLVGQSLRAWQAPPLKPVQSQDITDGETKE